MASVGLWAHFGRLFDVRGREDRASFWPYAALVYGIITVGSTLVMMPLLGSITFSVDQDLPSPPDFGSFVDGMLAMTLVGVLFYAAAVVRRLHDVGFSGWWGVMPLPFLTYSMIGMRTMFQSFGAGPRAMDGFMATFVSNVLYTLALLALIVLLARRSDPGPNRFDAGVR